MLYFIAFPHQPLQVTDLHEQELELDYHSVATRSPQLSDWERYVLMVLQAASEQHGQKLAVSYSVLHRYCVRWWLERERFYNDQLFNHILSAGRTPLTNTFGAHLLMWMFGISVQGIYRGMDRAIQHMIDERRLIHQVLPWTNDDGTVRLVHCYRLMAR